MEAQSNLTLDNMARTGALKPVKGVTGRSVFSNIPLCDRSKFVYPEYMHGILGVIKQFMHLWFETDLQYNFKKHSDEFDSCLASVRVPDYLTRCPE